ncbi:MAG: hypothetical protein HY300_20265 [Verrucomicrobia bacterium]|nr:hypothetical protein [Verrucomicrobiota bacterium]
MKTQSLRKLLLGKQRNHGRAANRLFPLRGRQASRLAVTAAEHITIRDPRKLSVEMGPQLQLIIEVRHATSGQSEPFSPGIAGQAGKHNGDSI